MQCSDKIHVIHMDCFDFFKTLQDKSIDVSFTSPPYNRLRNDVYEYYTEAIDDYYAFLKETIDELIRVTKGYVILNVQKNYYNKNAIFRIIGEYHEKISDIIIWNKTNPRPNSANRMTNAYEFFIIFSDESVRSNATYTKNVISTSVNSEMIDENKAIMKQEVADWFISRFTKEGELILDPFFGAGTTGISCKKYRRSCIGVEISKEMCGIARDRIDATIEVENLIPYLNLEGDDINGQ